MPILQVKHFYEEEAKSTGGIAQVKIIDDKDKVVYDDIIQLEETLEEMIGLGMSCFGSVVHIH